MITEISANGIIERYLSDSTKPTDPPYSVLDTELSKYNHERGCRLIRCPVMTVDCDKNNQLITNEQTLCCHSPLIDGAQIDAARCFCHHGLSDITFVQLSSLIVCSRKTML